ncbi:hypothetical protein GCM10023210_34840 [Chryseobacterium ginsengisoli]|uniref:DUF1795 domain-containing protein n=1 Tax=Chryseobacterium ginsengisoli TaxID=363853 RepID=A0ABP9MLZ6_9FLAO
MKSIFSILFSLFICFNIYAQNSGTEFYSPDFKWKIQIPEGFEKVNSEEWAKMQGKGEQALEKTVGQDVINHSKTIFIVKSGNFNYLETNYQPFDTKTDGNYEEANKFVNDIVYKSFKENMPDAKITNTTTKEKINNLIFYKSSFKILMPNNMTMEMIMFSRLFGKKEFTLNIMFMDPEKGEEMLNVWKNSTFSN